jgi:hypothetical protein
MVDPAIQRSSDPALKCLVMDQASLLNSGNQRSGCAIIPLNSTASCEGPNPEGIQENTIFARSNFNLAIRKIVL